MCVEDENEKLEKMGISYILVRIICIIYGKLSFSYKMKMRNMGISYKMLEIIIKIEVIKMKCEKMFGKLGSGIPWTECGGELEINRFHDSTGSVLFSKTVCKKCNDKRQGILWQR